MLVTTGELEEASKELREHWWQLLQEAFAFNLPATSKHHVVRLIHW
jgi:hypothetical protein